MPAQTHAALAELPHTDHRPVKHGVFAKVDCARGADVFTAQPLALVSTLSPTLLGDVVRIDCRDTMPAAPVADPLHVADTETDPLHTLTAVAARLGADLPLDQLHLPQLFGTTIGTAELEVLTDALLAGIEALPEAES